jgi:hypothetical protein
MTDQGNDVLAIEVTREDNPLFYDLMEEGEAIMHALGELMEEIGQLKVPKFRFGKARRRLREISKKHDLLSTGRYESWDLKVTNFAMAPVYGRIPRAHATIFFLHTTQNLRDQLYRVESQFATLGSFILAVGAAINNRESRVYAILALLISTLGLTLSTIAILISC